MKNIYQAVYEGGCAEITEKKSRFIATIRPVESEAEAQAFIDELKKKYYDASHNCSAYCIGVENLISHCSDDGEPSHTAGRPMLDVLIKEGIHNAAVVVTRYFGGTLLGTGGLVRAYSDAVKAGLAACVILEKKLARLYKIQVDYTNIGKLQYLAGQYKQPILKSDYTDSVISTLLLYPDEESEFLFQLKEATSSTAAVEALELCYAAYLGKELLCFPIETPIGETV